MSRKHRNRKSYTRQQVIARESEAEALREMRNYNASSVRTVTKTTNTPSSRNIYVLDTNVLHDCPNLLFAPDEIGWRPPENMSHDLSNADLIIPKVVFDELENQRGENNITGKRAVILLKRLKKIVNNSGRTLDEITSLKTFVRTGWNTQRITILPLDLFMLNAYPFLIDVEDHDTQIVLTAVQAREILNSGTLDNFDPMSHSATKEKGVILLTGDRPMSINTDLFSIYNEQFSYTHREANTGCRVLKVPYSVYHDFAHNDYLSGERFLKLFPNELPLRENEYVIFRPLDAERWESKFLPYSNIGRFSVKLGSLKPLAHTPKVKVRDEALACYHDALHDPDIHVVYTTGDAGVGKTFNAIDYAIWAIDHGFYKQIIYISSVRAKNDLGAVPGGLDQKMKPLTGFIYDTLESRIEQLPEFKKLRAERIKYGSNHKFSPKKAANPDYVTWEDVDDPDFEDDEFDYRPSNRERIQDARENQRSRKNSRARAEAKRKSREHGEVEVSSSQGKTYEELLAERVQEDFDRYFKGRCFPYEQVFGRTFNDSIIILDEFQRANLDAVKTLLTRPGLNSKLIVLGDVNQIYYKTIINEYNNGLVAADQMFYNWSGIARVHLTYDMRGAITEAATTRRNNTDEILLYGGFLG